MDSLPTRSTVARFGEEIETGSLKDSLEEIYRSRIRLAPQHLRRAIFDRGAMRPRYWKYEEYIGIHVGTVDEIREAEKRIIKYRNAYPNLFSRGEAIFGFKDCGAVVIRNGTFIGSAVFNLSGASSLVTSNITIGEPPQSYKISLMAVCTVPDIFSQSNTAPDLIDLAIAKFYAALRAEVGINDAG